MLYDAGKFLVEYVLFVIGHVVGVLLFTYFVAMVMWIEPEPQEMDEPIWTVQTKTDVDPRLRKHRRLEHCPASRKASRPSVYAECDHCCPACCCSASQRW